MKTRPHVDANDIESVACIVEPARRCGVDPFLDFGDTGTTGGAQRIFRCARCGTGFSRPAIPDIAALYADRSSRDFQPQTGAVARLIKRIAFRRSARRLVAGTGGMPSTVLDFACGSGLFTQCLSEILPDGTRVVGADFHGEPPAELRSVRYLAFDDPALPSVQADLVLAMHVVEHDDDAHALLRRIASLTRPGGRIVVEVPNIDCVWARIFGRSWDAWYMPYHRVHFSRAGLRGLAAACGLAVEREFDVSVPGLGRTLAHVLRRPNTLPFILVTAALQPLQWALEKLSGQPSALRVVLRKP